MINMIENMARTTTPKAMNNILFAVFIDIFFKFLQF
jgi:hypothetical protein